MALLVLAALLNVVAVTLLGIRIARLERLYVTLKRSHRAHEAAMEAQRAAVAAGATAMCAQGRLLTQLVDGHNHLYREMIGVVTSLPMRSALPPA